MTDKIKPFKPIKPLMTDNEIRQARIKQASEGVQSATARIQELELMLTIIWYDWVCDDCPEYARLEEIMKTINTESYFGDK